MESGSGKDGSTCFAALEDVIPGSVASDRWKLAVDVARGLQFLHAQRTPVVHGRLNPKCISVNIRISPPEAKIADFVSLSLGNVPDQQGGDYGTYVAPEVTTHGAHSQSADVYSYGAVLVFSCTGAAPTSSSVWPDELSSGIKLAGECMSPRAQDRPSMRHVCTVLISSDPSLAQCRLTSGNGEDGTLPTPPYHDSALEGSSLASPQATLSL